MTRLSNSAALLDSIKALAADIARASPESADKALRIVDLADAIEASAIDRASVQDAIEIGTADSDLSEAEVQNATSAVMGIIKDPKP